MLQVQASEAVITGFKLAPPSLSPSATSSSSSYGSQQLWSLALGSDRDVVGVAARPHNEVVASQVSSARALS